MRGTTIGVVVTITAFAVGMAAQTVNKIPKYTSSTTFADSAITEVNGNVGIGTTNPQALFDVNEYGGYYDIQFFNNGPNIAISGPAVKDSINFNDSDNNNQTVFEIGASNLINTWLISSANGWPVNMPGAGGLGIGYGYPWPTTLPQMLSVTGGGYFSGNVGIGTTNPQKKLDVAGDVNVAGSIYSADGSVQATAWNGTLGGGDYAESVDVSGNRSEYEPGDVLVVDPNDPDHFLKSSERYSTSVAGVYSTKPGVIGRHQTTDAKTSTTEILMAMVGIVPAKVSAENGPIRPGDILVTSSTPGHVMKGTDRSLFAGAIVGKALDSLDSGTGVIKILVSLQ